MDIGLHNAHAYLEAVKAHPASYQALRQKYPSLNPERAARDFTTAFETYMQGIGESPSRAQQELLTLKQQYDVSLAELQGVAAFKNGKWASIAGESITHELEDFQHIEDQLSKLLRGETLEHSNVRLTDRGVTEKFKKFESAVSDAHGVVNGWFSRALLDGPMGAVKQTAEDLQFWKAEAKGNRKLGISKAAVMVGGATAIGHAVAVDKHKDGEQRSGWGRLAEGAAGAAAIAGATMFGRIR